MLTINVKEELDQIKKENPVKFKFNYDFIDEKLEKNHNSDHIVERIGLGKRLKKEKNVNSIYKKYDKKRIYHIDHINELSDKYDLYLGKLKDFRGDLDDKLPFKLQTFETAHGVELNKKNCRILAPIELFDQEIFNEDPYVFYKIDNKHYYLIHNWGNDISWFRRFGLHKLNDRDYRTILYTKLMVIFSIILFISVFIWAGWYSQP